MKKTALALGLVIAVPNLGQADNVLTLRCDGKIYYDSLSPPESEQRGVGATINFTKQTVEWVIEGLIYSTQITRLKRVFRYARAHCRSSAWLAKALPSTVIGAGSNSF